MMCELPPTRLLAGAFLEQVDGFSIGSNGMIQLVLGLDRDSSRVAAGFAERDPAVLAAAIRACLERGQYVGICSQGPSDHPDFGEWLVQQGMATMPLNPDSVVDPRLHLAKVTPRADGGPKTFRGAPRVRPSRCWFGFFAGGRPSAFPGLRRPV
jgi:pyruvate,water dikinase